MQFHNPEEHKMSHKISLPKSLQEITVYNAPKVQSNMLIVLVNTPWYVTTHHSHNDVGIPLAKQSDLPQLITSISYDKIMTLSPG